MSANTSITEGGKPRPFGPVKALMVQGEDGKYYPWFPESDRALGTLSVDKNGIYRASDRGVYGWSRVSVNVPQNEGVSGKDPDTGEDVYVHPDPETGELVTDVLPVEIRVIEPPTNPYGTYVDGQTITKDGMVVKAYSANGDEMQTVPIGEITINPTTAVYDATTDYATATSDLIDFAVPISFVAKPTFDRASRTFLNVGVNISTGGPVAFIKDGNVLFFIFASDSPTNASYTVDNYARIAKTPNEPPYMYELIGSTSYGPINISDTYTYNSKTVYWHEVMLLNQGEVDYPVAYDVNSWPVSIRPKVAWTMVYGNVSGIGGHQTINVSWPRPGDGAVLETTFDILVGPHGGTGDD